ncbi:radical SAM/SPASM domain-containing protein [Clostridium beijerinckii]|uniref:radical SAM/SPASM domain-containing protein n=1 Tax=Clostridium beijerinckii TaxID=1520 RepID=UPI00156D9A44|nr:radical SAM protein [Clostridium beijerinckii]NRT73703.1 MoaA/NifB/PqqE/SkfB family radical SAM enzyme [Clostridium beijerinckii]
MKNEVSLKQRIEQYNSLYKSINPNFPKNMLIEVSNICNHNCIFCANSKSNRKKAYINSEFAKRILREAYELGTDEVGFYSTGEPLVDKNLEIYIKEAKSIGYKYTYITTNGALLDEERSKSIIDAGIDSIKFSINAGTKESYKFIHGKDDFGKVIKNLKYLSYYRKSNNKNFKIFISCILTKHTKEDREVLKEKFEEYVDEIIFLNCKNQCGVMYEINKYLVVDDEINDESNLCPLPFNKLHITCDGYLTVCCADFQNYLAIVDLNHETLEKAWNNSKFVEVRKKHIENRLEGTLCYNCINNANTEIEPLSEKLCTKIENKNFDKTYEIISRIKGFKNNNLSQL